MTKTCSLCPLQNLKKPDPHITQVDIVVISDKTTNVVSQIETKFPTAHIFDVECGSLGAKVPDQASVCCLGRKLEQVRRFKPKLVIAVGTQIFNRIDEACGTSLDYVPDFKLMPTSYKGHNFWLMAVPPFNVTHSMYKAAPQIRQAISTMPIVERNYFTGLNICITDQDINAAFNDLERNTVNGLDLETKELRPYLKGAKILSMAVGTDDRTYAFPLFHPQTPKLVNTKLILDRFYDLCSKCEMVLHNGPFDLEWLVNHYGNQIAYRTTWHDTMAQAYLLNTNPRRGKSLDDLVRLYFGFNLKQLSNLDRANLENYPLDLVLRYNALDTKYTYKVFQAQKPLIVAENLPYEKQIAAIPSTVLMQTKGLVVNTQFVEDETKNQLIKMSKIIETFKTIPEVNQFIFDHGNININSQDDIKLLHHSYLGVPKTQTSFDEEFLSNRNDIIAKTILDYRGVGKVYTTYLRPLNVKDTHRDAGKFILPDGFIHTLFNTMKTATGRLSSSSPNAQNYPKRDGGVYWRNAITVPPGYVLIAIDYGQMEYRMIAAITRDMEMINSIRAGLDIHGWWAKHLNESMFPDFFIDRSKCAQQCTKSKTNLNCSCYKCALKDFRGVVKNGLVFPFCYGSSAINVGQAIGLNDTHRANMVANEFWQKHQGIKAWQERLKLDLASKDYITTPYGRRYRAPLDFNKMVNYPIQGTSSDVVTDAMNELAKQSIIQNEPWLCPILNVHDDLTFAIPQQHVQAALQKIIPIMLDTRPYPWFPVPLMIEISGGKLWGGLQELQAIESNTIYPLNPI